MIVDINKAFVYCGIMYEIGDDVDMWLRSGKPDAHWETGYKVVGFGENSIFASIDGQRHDIRQCEPGKVRHT